jgi:hypothetical protein
LWAAIRQGYNLFFSTISGLVQDCFRRLLNHAKGIAIIPGIKRIGKEGKYYCFEAAVGVSL